MKTFNRYTMVFAITGLLYACSVRRGCPANGRNVGAEKLLNPDKKTASDLKKVRKFKS